jgi:hypothetical protein
MGVYKMREELGEKQQMKLLKEKQRVEKMKVNKEELEECKVQSMSRRRG